MHRNLGSASSALLSSFFGLRLAAVPLCAAQHFCLFCRFCCCARSLPLLLRQCQCLARALLLLTLSAGNRRARIPAWAAFAPPAQPAFDLCSHRGALSRLQSLAQRCCCPYRRTAALPLPLLRRLIAGARALLFAHLFIRFTACVCFGCQDVSRRCGA